MKRITYVNWRGADFGDGLVVEPGDTRELDDALADKLLDTGLWHLAAVAEAKVRHHPEVESKEPEPTVKKPAEKKE